MAKVHPAIIQDMINKGLDLTQPHNALDSNGLLATTIVENSVQQDNPVVVESPVVEQVIEPQVVVEEPVLPVEVQTEPVVESSVVEDSVEEYTESVEEDGKTTRKSRKQRA